jgi:hypothetical protein
MMKMRNRLARTLAALLLVAGASAALVACAPTPPPDGSLPCNSSIDVQRAAGFDASLEAQLPVAGWSAVPTQVDSGRECSEARLGPLWGAGVRELRSAGAIFDNPDRTGYTLVVYRADELTLDALAYAFERGARGGRKTQDIRTSDETVNGWPAFRMTLINGDHRQVIVLFAVPSEAPLVRGVLTSDLPDTEVSAVVQQYSDAIK